jgi:hypothetical protein
MSPRSDVAGCVDSTFHDVITHGTVTAGSQIVFTGPNELNRRAPIDGFGHHDRFRDVIAIRYRPAAEAAAGEVGMYLDLFGLQAQDPGSNKLIVGLKLASGPDGVRPLYSS